MASFYKNYAQGVLSDDEGSPVYDPDTDTFTVTRTVVYRLTTDAIAKAKQEAQENIDAITAYDKDAAESEFQSKIDDIDASAQAAGKDLGGGLGGGGIAVPPAE